jgi:hypothetical protein
MKLKIAIISLLLIVISCNSKINDTKEDTVINLDCLKTNKKIKPVNSALILKEDEPGEQEEAFADSTKIAKPGNYKIEILQKTIDTSTTVTFSLFQKNGNHWNNVQIFNLKKDCSVPMLTEIKDFNNDGYNDLTIHYSTAARGANDIRKLFIFLKNKNKFIEVKNSDQYPNLFYNNKLNCICALSVYSGFTTHFLQLKKDSLAEFAKVDCVDGEVQSYLVKNDKQILLKSKKYDGENDFMITFSNYDPIEE